ncbi:lysophospholipid acyltransferase family protein [Teichococcus deserti]|uniref:lysophospholipid acyltransferase family protein n=1 Tax=Teichococcus deserti TaxID=1817963 RepID=UPI0010567898|nr:lysophospholipid acyltransferase family protein [Pseudoroseomonas deserti]
MLARLLGVYLDLCRRTARWEIHGATAMRELASRPDGFMLAFWHECLPLMPMAWSAFWQGQPPAHRKEGLVMISRSRDGQMIARLLARFGLRVASGSSSAGGTKATRKLLGALRTGSVAVIVPDGPRGPRRRAGQGCHRMAVAAKVPIVPCAAHTAQSWRIGSWDRMVIPKPFARCIAVVGTPIMPEQPDLQAVLETALTSVIEEAARRSL